VGAAELLAELADMVGHLHVMYYIACRYASKKTRKSEKPEKSGVGVAATSKKARLEALGRALPHCLSCSWED
jgi:hypothetical protein